MTQSIQDLQEKNSQVLSDISKLQSTEQKMYESLDNPRLTPEQRVQIINKINELSQIRINLYTTLRNMAAYYQENVENSKDILGQQLAKLLGIEPGTGATGTAIQRDPFDFELRQRGGLAFWTIHASYCILFPLLGTPEMYIR